MGTFLDKPKTDKHNEHGCGNGLRYGVSSMQGWRVEMEDAHCAITGLSEELRDWSFFAVFDGHAGASVSAHCAEHLLECIVGTEEFRRSDVTKGIRSGFLNLDDRMRELPELASGEDKSGSTAVCALVSPKQVYVANCGDSRAVLCSNGVPVFSTQDHKPILPTEKERIQQAGGSVMIQRINGSLAVSRALGDYDYKNVEGRGPCEQLVSPEPEVFVKERDEENDEFLVLACDGVWDVMTNDDVCNYIRSRLAITDDLEAITNQVIDTCLYKGSQDNMSIVLVTFPAAPTPTPEAIQHEAEVEATIERRIEELVAERTDIEFGQLLHMLVEDNIQGLPPGGGLSAKRQLIESVYKKLCPNKAESVVPYVNPNSFLLDPSNFLSILPNGRYGVDASDDGEDDDEDVDDESGVGEFETMTGDDIQQGVADIDIDRLNLIGVDEASDAGIANEQAIHPDNSSSSLD